ncbi:MAG TPA: hypothetical protein VMT06_02775 [Candidatus Eisenbacteria bacterium]|nr:hypothetical protein [Candidatus Eisenbacteria bacterium]
MKSFADELKDFVDGNLTLINFVIAVCSLVSYVVTMYLLVYWTHWTDNAGAYGGVLDYRFLGISTVFHVTGQNVQGQALFAFPDITSYLLITLIILNLAMLRGGREAETSKFGKPEGLYTSLILGLACIFAYVWGTMIPAADFLKPLNMSPGGVLEYSFSLAYSVYHVTSGYLESIGVGFGFDFTAWLLLVIITLNLIATASVRWSRRQN